MKKILISALIGVLSFNSQASQPLTLNQLQERIVQLESQITPPNQNPFQLGNLVISGLMEVETAHTEPFDSSEDDTSDTSLAAFELAMEARVNSHTDINVTFLYEENDTPFEVDTASISFDNDQDIYAVMGQIYLPFGTFETQQVNDTLALSIAETRNSVLMTGFTRDGFNAAIYIFSNDEGKLNQGGLRLNYRQNALSLGIDYINNTLNSDAFQAINEETNNNTFDSQAHCHATSLHMSTEISGIALNAEYINLNNINTDTDKLKVRALQTEIAYQLAATTLAFSYQQTQDAAIFGLPEQRFSITSAYNLLKNTRIAMELWHDQDFNKAHGGTNSSSNSLVIQASVEF